MVLIDKLIFQIYLQVTDGDNYLLTVTSDLLLLWALYGCILEFSIAALAAKERTIISFLLIPVISINNDAWARFNWDIGLHDGVSKMLNLHNDRQPHQTPFRQPRNHKGSERSNTSGERTFKLARPTIALGSFQCIFFCVSRSLLRHCFDRPTFYKVQARSILFVDKLRSVDLRFLVSTCPIIWKFHLFSLRENPKKRNARGDGPPRDDTPWLTQKFDTVAYSRSVLEKRVNSWSPDNRRVEDWTTKAPPLLMATSRSTLLARMPRFERTQYLLLLDNTQRLAFSTTKHTTNSTWNADDT